MSKNNEIVTLMKYCNNTFSKMQRYVDADNAIRDIIKREIISKERICEHCKNEFGFLERKQFIQMKVSFINDLYVTQLPPERILSIATYLEHNYEQINIKLKAGDSEVVNDIARKHINNNSSETQYNAFSFATKYAHWHEPEKYFIFDRFVVHTLWLLNLHSEFGLTLKKYKKSEGLWNYFRTHDYRLYDEVMKLVKNTMVQYDPRLTNKSFDQALWVYGKYKLTGDNFKKSVKKEIYDEIFRLDPF